MKMRPSNAGSLCLYKKSGKESHEKMERNRSVQGMSSSVHVQQDGAVGKHRRRDGSFPIFV